MDRVCIRKTQYKSEEIANEMAAKLAREQKIDLRSYLCTVCDRWHLTSQPLELRPGFRPPRKSARTIAFERDRAEFRRNGSRRSRRGPPLR